MTEEVLAPEAPVTQEQQPDVAPNVPTTPEDAFGDGQDKGTLLDDFFRANKMEEQIPSEEVQVEPSPVEVTSQGTPAEESGVDNDVKRYQYWQSEADKARNEKQQLEERLQALEQQRNQPQPEEIEPIEEDLSFPDPPQKPGKPRSYSRTEALEDPESDSARYQEAVDNWRDDMDEYNRLHSQYTQAVMVEERERIRNDNREIQKAQAEKEAYSNNMAQMKQHLQANYQASDDEISRFVEVMDDPKNITVDNLFQLYRMQNGGQVANAPLTQTAQSDSFEQRKRAQSVPSPMGVVTGQSSSQQSGQDSMMDSMLNDYKKRNPFG
tara:strand:+ start:3498 stop:4469 length:972 start_codon:yes stop_codon:yes gene_type:complete